MSKYVKALYKLADELEQNTQTYDATIVRQSGMRMELLEQIVLDGVVEQREIDNG